MGCKLPGEPGRRGPAVAGACSPYPELPGSKERQGSEGAEGSSKGVGGASAQGREKGRVDGQNTAALEPLCPSPAARA